MVGRSPLDGLIHDGQGAPYLRYWNNKMSREAAVPIDEELELPGVGPNPPLRC